MDDLTPKYKTISFKEKVVMPDDPTARLGTPYGGWNAESDALSSGNVRLEATNERILIGSATASMTGAGIFQGLESSLYKWRVGNPSGDYALWDGVNLTISGSISAGSISIGTTPNWFRVDSSGNIWSGQDTLVLAKANTFAVENTGALFAKSATITGAITTSAGSSLDGQYLTANSVASASANLAMRGWTYSGTFSATDYRVVAWTAGTFTASDGTAYSITGANTGNIAATTYIYLDIAVSTTALQTTTTASTAIGNGKVLVAVASPNSDTTSYASYQVFGGTGGQRLFVDNISANSASTNEFVSNSAQLANLVVTDAKINSLAVSKLAAGTITSKAILMEISDGTGDTYLGMGNSLDIDNWRGGDANSGAIIIGLDDSVANNPAKFFVGNYSTGDYISFNVQVADRFIFTGSAYVSYGNVLFQSADTSRTNATASFLKKKEIMMGTGGSVNVYFELQATSGSFSCEGQIYVNGSPVGTLRQTTLGDTTTWFDWTEAITDLETGDLVQLYMRYGNCRNFRLKVREFQGAIVNTD